MFDDSAVMQCIVGVVKAGGLLIPGGSDLMLVISALHLWLNASQSFQKLLGSTNAGMSYRPVLILNSRSSYVLALHTVRLWCNVGGSRKHGEIGPVPRIGKAG
jgi:hypothetical protein